MIKELDLVVLRTALPELGLGDGDIGTVVMVHDDGAGYEVEFTALDGRPWVLRRSMVGFGPLTGARSLALGA
jgi:hypothetical protein